MKLNNKGMSIIEIVLTFALVMFMVIGMLTIIVNYKAKSADSLVLLDMNTFKNTITRSIQNDILKKGVLSMEYSEANNGTCYGVSGLHRCIKIFFQDGDTKILGTSIVNNNDRNSIENKFIYYDGEKYKLIDILPDKIPEGRVATDFQNIIIDDSNILSVREVTIPKTEDDEEDQKVKIYSINIGISYVGFDDDFGIHIVATNEEVKIKLARAIIKNETQRGTLIDAQPDLAYAFDATKEAAGLYSSTDTNYGDTTYYFRGNDVNNYVAFAGYLWRIVRINEDNSIRIILNTGINNNKTYKFSGTSNYTNAYYSNSTVAKSTLEDWYNTNLLKYDNYIIEGKYCEQARVKSNRSYSAGNATLELYSSYTPTFKCDTDGNDKGIIDAKIGLITYDEMVFAGSKYNTANVNYIVSNKKNSWTMTQAGNGREFYLSSDNKLVAYGVAGSTDDISGMTLRPVINLDGNLEYLGDGSIENPYAVDMSNINEKIFADNITIDAEIAKSSSANVNIGTVAKEAAQSGFFKTDQTNSGENTYFFRGIIENNYVKFANYDWRIIRINEDGSIRLILDKAATDIVDQIFDNNTPYFSNNSNAKQVLENWYQSNLNSYDNYIVNTDFCEAFKAKWGTNTYLNANPVSTNDYVASYICPEDDGNNFGIYSGKIGLLSVDEAIFAGANFSKDNGNYFLTSTNVASQTRIMNPAMVGADGVPYTWILTNYDSTVTPPPSSISHRLIKNKIKYRPVISIKGNLLTTGSGTKEDMYIIRDTNTICSTDSNICTTY